MYVGTVDKNWRIWVDKSSNSGTPTKGASIEPSRNIDHNMKILFNHHETSILIRNAKGQGWNTN